MRLRFLLLLVSCLLCSGTAHAETTTLEQAWAQVYHSNPSLMAARAELRAIDEHVSQALSHWRPNVDVTSNIGKTYQSIRDQQPAGSSDFSGTSRSVGVRVTQPIFRGFRTIAETDAAENRVKAARAKLNNIEQQLFLDTAAAYLDILRDQIVLDAAKDNEIVLEQKLKETQERSRVGELTITDTHQAESRLARAHVTRLQTESSLTKSRAAYLRLVGKTPDQLMAADVATEKDKKLEDILQLAETNNPNVVAARYSIDEAKARVDLNKGSLLPEVNLVGSSTRGWAQNSSLPGREDTSQVMLQLTVPLYHAGADYSRTREAEQVVSQRQMNLEEARHKAHENAVNAWQTLETAQAALAADAVAVTAATLALKGVKEEAKVGTRTTLDVLNAEQELLDAKVDRAKSQHDRDLAILQIRAAIGALTAETLNLHVEELYNPKHQQDDARTQ